MDAAITACFAACLEVRCGDVSRESDGAPTPNAGAEPCTEALSALLRPGGLTTKR